MKFLRGLMRVFGWLLTPLVAWAASFLGATAVALVAPDRMGPRAQLIATVAGGGIAGVNACRVALGMGAEVTVVAYLKTQPSRDELARLYAKAGILPRDGLRKAEDSAKALKGASDDAILDAMAADPILIERPLVETEKGVRLGRPPEAIREIL